MSTSLILFGMASRTSANVSESSGVYGTGGRVRFDAELVVAAITGTLQIKLWLSPTGEDGTWEEAVDFGSITATGITEKDSAKTSDWSVVPDLRHRFVKATVEALSDTTIFELRMGARFFNPKVQADADLLSKALRTYADGLVRLCLQAELDVVQKVSGRVRNYRVRTASQPLPLVESTPELVERLVEAPLEHSLDVDVTIPGFLEAMRLEIARQADWLFTKERLLQNTGKVGAQRAAAKMGPTAPNLGRRLREFRPGTAGIFRGR